MRKPTWGPIVQERVRNFIEVLQEPLDELYDHKKWEEENSSRPKLVIKSKRRVLERLARLKQHEFYEAMQTLQALQILEDRRFNKQGSDDWYFVLKLWSKDSTMNSTQFDLEWQNRKSKVNKS